MAATRKTSSARHARDADVDAVPLADLVLPAGEDVVGMVSRNADGSPAQSEGFVLLVAEGASDGQKAAAWNLGGELPPESRVVYYRPVF